MEDPYCHAGTGLLRNRLGITPETVDAESTLVIEEAFRSGVRLAELVERPLAGLYDIVHLRAFHRHIFGDVYQWAGEFRTVSISKGGVLFALPQFIEPAGRDLFAALAAEGHLRNLNGEKFAARLAYYLGEVNMLHPFRDGNGRAQRALFSQLARDAGLHLAWNMLSSEENVTACNASAHGDPEPLRRAIVRITSPR
jgi:cell filamentation protein